MKKWVEWEGGLQTIVEPPEKRKMHPHRPKPPFFQQPSVVVSALTPLHYHFISIYPIAIGSKCSLGINLYYCLQLEHGPDKTHTSATCNIQLKKYAPLDHLRECIGIPTRMRTWSAHSRTEMMK